MDPAGFEPAASTLRTPASSDSELEKLSALSALDNNIENSEPRGKLDTPLNSINHYILKYAYVKGTNELPPAPITEYEKKELFQYLIGPEPYGRAITVQRARTYINALNNTVKPLNLKDPRELMKANLKETPILGLAALIEYIDKIHEVETIGGYTVERWKAFIKAPKRGKTKKRKELETEEIEAVYHELSPEIQPFFKMLVYTGMRGSQLIRMMKAFDPSAIRTSKKHPKISWYDTSDLSTGTKETEIAFFPSSMIPEIEKYRIPNYHESTLTRMIRDAGARIAPRFIHLSTDTEIREAGGEAPVRVTTKQIRKYQAQALIESFGDRSPDTTMIDYIQGRSLRSVLLTNYVNPQETAAAVVNQALDSLPTFKTPAAKTNQATPRRTKS
ncbi:hypothetical protein FTO68_06300 [Methanocalculus taiwanensis]|uniref:Integrase SSV1 C-terminal domain-containing protein n=1 Tax=Methanocalculus taiwanensis TaxID=106207 RepID=A0ABD4TIM7_9EURY|nr:integrase [Methanocalculus taiwanensis]MCQ1538596.1 hypothetical protein [Methanocalculus taiwanensis]